MTDISVSRGDFSPVVGEGFLLVQPKLLYSRKEAARLLSLSIRSLDYLIESIQIAVVRIGRRVFIRHQELLRLSRRTLVSGRVQ